MSRLSSPRLWLSLVSIVVVLWIIQRDLDERTSPGQLGASHAAVAELQGSAGCDACHGDGPDDLARACGTCHEAVDQGIAAGTGFHGTLDLVAGAARAAEVPVRDCGACHFEHHGADFPAITERSFELAGFGSRATFDHGRLGYEPEGRHAELSCEQCHPHADAAALLEGEPRFGGLDTGCATCHEDPHEGRMDRDCAACHGPAEDFLALAAFEHTLDFPLADAHALAGAEGCRSCHDPAGPHAVEALAGHLGAGLEGPAARRCAACHESPHGLDFLAGTDALPGATARPAASAMAPGEPLDVGDCAACHRPDVAGFGPASLVGTELDHPERARELHAATGFPLEVPHAELDCAACHEPAPPGGPTVAFGLRFPGRAADDCAACHTDPHEGSNGPSCVDCHQASGPWADLSLFDHRADFPLSGVHGQLACASCHETTGPSAVAELTARADMGLTVATRTCAACHEQPHALDFLDGVAELLATPGSTPAPQDTTCRACHGTELEPSARGGPGFQVVAEDFPVDLHAASGMTLTLPHQELACAACHGDPAELVPTEGRTPQADAKLLASTLTFGERFLARPEHRAPEDCGVCHLDPHGGRLGDSPLVTAAGIEPAPGGCRACHLDERFTPTRVDAALHGASGFALEGGHDAVGCYDCHAELEPEGVPRFAETPRACEACHDDVHAGAFDGATAALMEAPEGTSGCALCHVTSSFHDVPAVAEGRFDHAGLCGFALQGAHAEAACAACHGPELAGPGGDPGRSFGRVAVLTPGDPARCTTCHSDPHGEAFASGPAEIAGATDCLRCHDQQSFRLAAEAPFDHGLWTGFELLGPHAASDCASCHGRSASSAGGAEGTSLGRAAGSACADCHGDVHLGQFTLPGEPRTDCTRCHAVPGGAADGWIASRFDHDQTFELDPTHAALDCAACHLAYPTGSGLEVVRYRPLGRTCEACHGSPDPGGDR